MSKPTTILVALSIVGVSAAWTACGSDPYECPTRQPKRLTTGTYVQVDHRDAEGDLEEVEDLVLELNREETTAVATFTLDGSAYRIEYDVTAVERED